MRLFSLTCREASRLQSQALDTPLGLRQKLALGFHLGLCDACRKVGKQLEFLRRATRAYPGPDDKA